ncbi:hypothetical protein [Brevundimonas sp.]|uniref:hypothetical protein n=1 Tax=Brevundimonas sp. TaxID=1871086 RepID=UPI00262F40A2|nr:hypothetical protein [Brevundimonas sp.]
MLLSRLDRALSGQASKGGRDRQPAAQAGPPSAEASAGMIGERFETVQASLDELADLAQRFSRFEAVLGQLRTPLAEEFNARRDAHVELINLRATNAELSRRVDELGAEARAVSDALAQAEGRAEEFAALDSEHLAGLQEARFEIDRLRSEASQTQARIESLEAADSAAAQRIRELEQDQQGLREQLRLAEEARAEADTVRAQSQRDHALALEEAGSLRRRLEEVGIEVAALARAATTGEAQLAAERARAAAEQAELVRAQRALENQVDADRAEIAALKVKLDAATAKANGLDVLNGEQAARLAGLQATAHGAERKAETLQTHLDRALERTRALEATAEEARQRQAAMEAARLAAVDRAETLAKAATAHDKAMARAEERMLKIQAKLAAVQDEHQAKAQAMAQQISGLRAELEGARAEASMATAALESARRDRGAHGAAASDVTRTVQPIVG